jgi:hypothetical protein
MARLALLISAEEIRPDKDEPLGVRSLDAGAKFNGTNCHVVGRLPLSWGIRAVDLVGTFEGIGLEFESVYYRLVTGGPVRPAIQVDKATNLKSKALIWGKGTVLEVISAERYRSISIQ